MTVLEALVGRMIDRKDPEAYLAKLLARSECPPEPWLEDNCKYYSSCVKCFLMWANEQAKTGSKEGDEKNSTNP